MDFSTALVHIKEGRSVTRVAWNGKGKYVRLQVPDYKSFMTLPYIYLALNENQRVPWLTSQTDILATDWEVVSV